MRQIAGFVTKAATWGALALAPVVAYAHAALVSSTPSAHQTVGRNPLHVMLKFNSRVDGKRSTVQLADAHGATRTLVLAEADSQDTVEADAGSLTPGAYTLRWIAVAGDGHITRGEIPFEVR